MKPMTRSRECSATPLRLLLAFELGQQWWKVGFSVEGESRPWTRRIAAGAVGVVMNAVAQAKARFGLPADTPVISCYEAGRDGFWLHRYLVAQGVSNHVVDSSSIEVNRRARRAKTDGLDLRGLLSLLARFVNGDGRAWRVVRVPSVAEEDARQLHRTWQTLQQDRTRLINRLKAVSATQGLVMRIGGDVLERLAGVRLWDGAPLPDGARQRLTRDWRQLQAVEQQLEEVAAARAALPIDPHTPMGRYVSQLQTLCAIGPIGAWVLTTEIFGWRQIRNTRELGALVGLAPALYQSGEMQRDQGITRAGNARARRMMVQLAWQWLRYQPESALAQWYQRRFAGGGRRARRIGIVALARKLLIALWRYVEAGMLPEGAQRKLAAEV